MSLSFIKHIKHQTYQSTGHTLLMTPDDTRALSSVCRCIVICSRHYCHYSKKAKKHKIALRICISGSICLRLRSLGGDEKEENLPSSIGLVRDQELLQMQILTDHIKASSVQFMCARKCEKAKHSLQHERRWVPVKGNHSLCRKASFSLISLDSLWIALIASCAVYRVQLDLINTQSTTLANKISLMVLNNSLI